MTDKKEIMVSIWCQTYNHKDYIRDALRGFVAQKTNFAFEIVVYDDASTDGTSDIVREYADKYPDIFRVTIAENNIFSSAEGQINLRKKQRKDLRGKYIGFCEGDDYWIDCNKLQMQVDYMESHPDCPAYFHNALRLDCRDLSLETIDPYECSDERELTAEELIMLYRAHPPTASILFKRDIVLGPDFIDLAPGRDYALELYALSKGDIHYNSRIMSVYRFFRPGSYTETISEDRIFAFRFYFGMTSFLMQYDRYTEYRYHVWITSRIQSSAEWFMYSMKSDKELIQFYDECQKEGYFSEAFDEECLEKIKCLRAQTFDASYYGRKIEKFVQTHKNIVFMGIGNYSRKLTEQFVHNHVKFAGYAVSRKKDGDADTFMGKSVWELTELPLPKGETGVVIAINPMNWNDILQSLENAGIEHYFCPFLLDQGGNE